LSGGIEENPRPKDAGFVPFVTRAAGKPLAHHQRPTIRLRFLFSPQAGAPMNLDVLLPQPSTEEERLECLLQRRLGSRIRNVRVQLLPDGLVLQGRVATFYAKQLAQHVAMESATVPILANDIEVV
jgi:hypothetical protein